METAKFLTIFDWDIVVLYLFEGCYLIYLGILSGKQTLVKDGEFSIEENSNESRSRFNLEHPEIREMSNNSGCKLPGFPHDHQSC